MIYLPTPCGKVIQVQEDQALILDVGAAASLLEGVRAIEAVWETAFPPGTKQHGEFSTAVRQLAWAIEEAKERQHGG